MPTSMWPTLSLVLLHKNEEQNEKLSVKVTVVERTRACDLLFNQSMKFISELREILYIYIFACIIAEKGLWMLFINKNVHTYSCMR